MNDFREIVLDTETTGLELNDGHRVVEIGCVELINRIPTGNIFHTYVNPEMNMPEGAYKIHGISTQFLQDKPLFKAISNDFIDFIGNSVLIIHNAVFDLKFLNSELARCGFNEIYANRVIDTLLMARKKYPRSAANLNALCKKFNISLKDRSKHGALLDAKLLAMVYMEMTDGKQSKLNLMHTNDSTTIVKRDFRESRHFKPTQQELETHAQLIKRIQTAVS